MPRPFPARFLASALAAALVTHPATASDPAQSVLSAVNDVRAQAGCGPLKPHPALEAAARGHARSMAEQDFVGHTGKDDRGFADRIRVQGYAYGSAAENIAAGQPTAARAVQAWLNNPGHRRNILNCSFRDTGIALVYQPEDAPLEGRDWPLHYYWVQLFGVER